MPTHHPKNTMRAVLWEGRPFHVSIKSIPIPSILSPDDAVIRITTSAICGSDLHTYRGVLGSTNPPWQMGHEAVGIVHSIGDGVTSVKVGDRVVVPAAVDDGILNLGPENAATLTYGFGDEFGQGLGGAQAEYIRVPQASESLIPLPPAPTGKNNDTSFLFLSDIFCTGWGALDFSGFQSGDTVAVFGAGPVGLLCAYSALLRGASRVYVIDHIQQRLDKAKQIGAIPINFTHGNAADQILKLEPTGVNRSCDCCGYQCVDAKLKPQQNAILNDALKVTEVGGGIGIVGIYVAQEDAPGRPRADTIAPTIEFNISEFWLKGLSMRAGIVDPKKLAPRLLELVKSGRADLDWLISREIGIEDADEGYRRFDQGKETKVVIRFRWREEEAKEGREGRSKRTKV